jgi:hypothetical protein
LEFKAGWQARQIVWEKNSGGVFRKKMIKRYHERPFAVSDLKIDFHAWW